MVKPKSPEEIIKEFNYPIYVVERGNELKKLEVTSGWLRNALAAAIAWAAEEAIPSMTSSEVFKDSNGHAAELNDVRNESYLYYQEKLLHLANSLKEDI